MTDDDVPTVRRVLRRCLTAASLMGLLTSPAVAQDSTSVVRMRGLRVEVPRPATTTGGTSAVEVALDSLRVVAAPTMEQLLRRVPLIQIRTNSRGEAQPALRGAEDRQIAILLDGIPLTVGWDHRTDLSIIPMTAVRNLTLLRGLSSMLHGANVLGGAMEFDVARGATLQSPPPMLTGALSVDHEGGVSAVATGGAFIERDFSSWVLRSGAGFRDRPGVTVPGGAKSDPGLTEAFLADDDGLRLNSDRRQIDGFVATRYRGIGGAWFSGLVSAFDVERGAPPEAHLVEPRLWRYPLQTRALVALSGGTGERVTSWGTGDLEATVGVDRSKTEIDEYATAAYQEIAGGETGESTTLTGRLLADHSFRESGELRSALTFSRVGHTEGFLDGSSFDYQQRLWSLGGEAELGSPGFFGIGDVGETRWTVGAAIDGSSTPESGDKPPIESLWDWGVRGGATSTSAGGNVLYHFGFSRRTRFPSLRELYSGALGRFEPNPELRPESLQAAEAGVTLNGAEGQVQVVGFHHRLGDGIVRTSVETPEGSKFQRVNRDEVRSTGLEILASGARGRFTFGGDLTVQRVRIRDPLIPDGDDRAEYEPAVSGKLSVDFAAPNDVVVSGFVNFRGSQLCENVEAGLNEVDRSATVELEATRGFSIGSSEGRGPRFLDATIALGNATDATVLDQCGLPQPGRTFRVQLNVR